MPSKSPPGGRGEGHLGFCCANAVAYKKGAAVIYACGTCIWLGNDCTNLSCYDARATNDSLA